MIVEYNKILKIQGLERFRYIVGNPISINISHISSFEAFNHNDLKVNCCEVNIYGVVYILAVEYSELKSLINK